MLEIKNLSIRTREPILDDFSYSFEKGKIYGMIATNGSGKTTFFRAVMGLINKKGGIFLDSKPLRSQKNNFFYFEDTTWLNKNVTGLDYLKLIKSEWQSKQSFEDYISYWNMGDYINLPIKKYSLGMKQRLIISMYLISEADVLLMDEITNGLDEESREKLFVSMKEYTQRNKIIIMSSHYKEDILPICNALITLDNRKMLVSDL
ncbi:MAG: ABC transporter ATP-binding protein [Streptococcaceae bacterium]|jgi:ABC-2 type transport system ATP-binding protein|nr:ABC transporter ATP-binding protein [Streptococcaceae bacterium]